MNAKSIKTIVTNSTDECSTDQYYEPWGELIKCPVCGDDYAHMTRATYVEGREKLDLDSNAGKQGAIVVPMYCESGHAWEVVFNEHKGNSYVGIINIHTKRY